ncbi:MAG: hypothetical protein FJ387_30635 [Verrucomicrobia bacterium]|nr:hypothetical protein [Verrucomicrobiota bacterium]
MSDLGLAARGNELVLRTYFLLASLVIGGGGCGTYAKLHPPPPPGTVLIERDREFAQFALQHGMANAFREFAAPDAVQLPMGELPIRGREAIFQAL